MKISELLVANNSCYPPCKSKGDVHAKYGFMLALALTRVLCSPLQIRVPILSPSAP